MKIPPFQIENYIQKIADEKISGCLVFGPESSLVSHRFDLIAKKISPNLSDAFLVVNLSKERIAQDKAILADEFFAISMFGGRKLILVKDCDASTQAALKAILQDGSFAQKTDNFILIQGGDLDKSSALRKIFEDSSNLAAIACYEDDERSIKKFIQEELIKRKIKFDALVVDILLEKFGKNRQIILTELKKILVFLGDGKELKADLINDLTASEAEISANEFIMIFADKNYESSIKMLHKLFRDSFEPITLIRFLSNYLQKLYVARSEIELSGVDFEDAVKNQKLFFKIEADFRKQLKNFKRTELVRILNNLEELEVEIKKAKMPPKLLFSAFLQEKIAEK